MEDQIGADAALEKLHGTEIDGRRVKVQRARAREDRTYGTSAYSENSSLQENKTYVNNIKLRKTNRDKAMYRWEAERIPGKVSISRPDPSEEGRWVRTNGIGGELWYPAFNYSYIPDNH